MSNKKQSSIELFAIALYEGGYLQGNGDEINELLEQHKAIHEEEIENAFDIGVNAYYDLNSPSNREQYYNEKFGGNNEQQETK
jgi:hypothetical protein